MAVDVTLPELGENLEGGEVLDVKVRQGETVSEGQTLLEVEAEKSTVDVPAPLAGRVATLLVKKGDKIKVGQAICQIDADDSSRNGGVTAKPPKVVTSEKTEAEPKKAAARDGQEPVQHASDTLDEPTQNAVPIATASPANAERPQEPPVSNASGASPVVPEKPVPAGPATRRLARELGIDLQLVLPTAKTGRVSAEDVKAYVKQLATSAPARTGAARQAPPLPDFAKWGPVERKPMDPVRRKTAEQMALAWQVPHVTQHDEADITDLDAFRKQQEKSGPKLTITAFALRAAASALKQFPRFNASLDFEGGQIVFKRYYHIGVAVDTERGLLVPVLRDVDRKSVRELGQELADVADRARQKKITREEMRGGTFTITNLGGIGGTGFTPIINYPEVAILGLSRGRLQPVVRDGEIVPRLIVPLSLSYDHRVIDGADAARFTRRISEMLENPLQMLL